MNTPAKVAGFLVALAAVFGVALGIGKAGRPGIRTGCHPRTAATTTSSSASR